MSHATHPVAWTAYAVMLLCIGLHTIAGPCASAQVVINEIMYTPGSGEPEWVELFNQGDASVDLEGWILHDRTRSRPTLGPASIAPASYLLITKDSGALRLKRPIGAPIHQLSLPSFNNSGDDLLLKDAGGKIVDSVPYRSSWGGTSGLSLERRAWDGSSVSSENWGSTLDTTGATPGARNSLTPVEHDLAVGILWFDQQHRRLSVPIVNVGSLTSGEAIVNLYDDRDRDSVGAFHESLSGRTIGPIPSGDSTIVEFLWSSSLSIAGSLALVVVDYEGDQVMENNHGALLLRRSLADSGVVVNEFMADPEDEEPEWIELANRLSEPVNLTGWIVHDAGSSRPTLPESTIPAGGYVVLTSDSARFHAVWDSIPAQIVEVQLPALNNGGDLLVLKRPDNHLLDSFRYSSSWGGGDGVSLERRSRELASDDPASWSSSLDPSGGTPGRANSIGAESANLELRSVRFDHDRSLLLTEVRSSGSDPIVDPRIIAGYDTDQNGTIERDEEVSTASIPEGSDRITIELEWNRPLTLEGEAAIIFLRTGTAQSQADDTLRLLIRLPSADTGAIINEFMADPLEDEPEWVEVYNRSEETINLAGWKVGDATSLTPPLNTYRLDPGSFVLITPDSSALIDRFGASINIIQTPLPALNNNGDQIRLINSNGTTVDSFRYGANWGVRDGLSLERESPHSDPTLGSSWGPSPDPLGGTPGRKNSWRPVQIDLYLTSLQIASSDSIVAFAKNRGDGSVAPPDSFRAKLGVDLNDNHALDPGEELAERTYPFPRSNDSVQTAFQWTRPRTVAGERALIMIEVNGEERPEDNLGSLRLARARTDSGVIINEFMAEPPDGEPEWVELLNLSRDSIDLKEWVIHDAGAARPRLPAYTIGPGQFLVLTNDSAALLRARPVFADLLELPLPTLNNGGDLLLLRGSSGRTVDSVRYRTTWGLEEERSLERRDPLGGSNDATNWGASIDGGGGTPGWENSIVPAEIDLRLEGAEFHPEESTVSLTITNVGRAESPAGEVRIYHDNDRNGSPGTAELEVIETVPRLARNATLTVEVAWVRTLLAEGEEGLAMLAVPGEERPEDNLHPFTPRAPLGSDGVVINEFLSSPVGSTPEWIELQNVGSLPVNLDRWSVADGASEATIRGELILHPEEYLLITSDGDLLRSAYAIPEERTIIEVALPALNNGADEISLRNSESMIVDLLTYDQTWSQTSGLSLERRHRLLPSNSTRSWESSVDPEGGTPGRQNSVEIPRLDLAIDSARFDPWVGRLLLRLENRGALDIPGGRLHVMLEEREIEGIPLGPLPFDNGLTLEVAPTFELTDEPVTLTLLLSITDDVHQKNDTAWVEVYRAPADQGLLITEVMFDPAATAEGPGSEYVELYNIGDRPVPLAGWSIEEGSGRATILSESAPALPVGEFGVIASDTAIYREFPELAEKSSIIVVSADLGLNNDADRVRLLNRSGLLVDSLSYRASWHVNRLLETRGVALERLVIEEGINDSTIWSSSVDRRGGTPGEKNSRMVEGVAGEGALVLSSETISPDGDGFEDFLRIAWHLPFNPASISLTLYDREGRRVSRLVDNHLTGPEGEHIWDGLTENGEPLPIGPYRLYLEAYGLRDGEHLRTMQLVVVAERL